MPARWRTCRPDGKGDSLGSTFGLAAMGRAHDPDRQAAARHHFMAAKGADALGRTRRATRTGAEQVANRIDGAGWRRRPALAAGPAGPRNRARRATAAHGRGGWRYACASAKSIAAQTAATWASLHCAAVTRGLSGYTSVVVL